MEAAERHLQQAVARVTRTDPSRRPAHPIDQINQPGNYQSWLSERGLTDVSVTTHPLHLSTTPEIAWLVVTGSGFIGALGKLKAAEIDNVRDAYLTSLDDSNLTELDATTLIGAGTRPLSA